MEDDSNVPTKGEETLFKKTASLAGNKNNGEDRVTDTLVSEVKKQTKEAEPPETKEKKKAKDSNQQNKKRNWGGCDGYGGGGYGCGGYGGHGGYGGYDEGGHHGHHEHGHEHHDHGHEFYEEWDEHGGHGGHEGGHNGCGGCGGYGGNGGCGGCGGYGGYGGHGHGEHEHGHHGHHAGFHREWGHEVGGEHGGHGGHHGHEHGHDYGHGGYGGNCGYGGYGGGCGGYGGVGYGWGKADIQKIHKNGGKSKSAAQKDDIPAERKQTIHVGYGYASGDNYRLGYGNRGMGGVSRMEGGLSGVSEACAFDDPSCHSIGPQLRSGIPNVEEERSSDEENGVKRNYHMTVGHTHSAYGQAAPYGHPVTHPGFTTIGYPGQAITSADIKNMIPAQSPPKAKRQIFTPYEDSMTLHAEGAFAPIIPRHMMYPEQPIIRNYDMAPGIFA